MSTEIQKPSRNILFSEVGNSIEERLAWYRHMRETQPIRYRPEYNSWEVFRYEDVQKVLADYATFSIEGSIPEGVPEGGE